MLLFRVSKGRWDYNRKSRGLRIDERGTLWVNTGQHPRVIIGRDPNSDIVLLGDDKVSRTHLQVSESPDGIVVADQSSHGTYYILPGHSEHQYLHNQALTFPSGTRFLVQSVELQIASDVTQKQDKKGGLVPYLLDKSLVKKAGSVLVRRGEREGLVREKGQPVLYLRDKKVSRTHALLTFKKGEVWVQDWKSSNHTFVAQLKGPLLVLDDPKVLVRAEPVVKAGDHLIYFSKSTPKDAVVSLFNASKKRGEFKAGAKGKARVEEELDESLPVFRVSVQDQRGYSVGLKPVNRLEFTIGADPDNNVLYIYKSGSYFAIGSKERASLGNVGPVGGKVPAQFLRVVYDKGGLLLQLVNKPPFDCVVYSRKAKWEAITRRGKRVDNNAQVRIGNVLVRVFAHPPKK